MLCKSCNENEIAPHSKRRCEECLRKNRESAKKRRDADRNGFNAKMRVWSREYREKNLDKVKAWEKKYAQSEKRKITRKAEHERKRDFYRTYKQEWDKSNPEKLSGYYKKYNTTHQPRLSSHAKKRARLKEENGGTFSWGDWLVLCEHYENKCLWCGKKKTLTVDHVIPLTKGGRNEIDNLQPLCRSCNSKKNSKTIDFRPFGNWVMEWT